jgi:hypothetical protein
LLCSQAGSFNSSAISFEDFIVCMAQVARFV